MQTHMSGKASLWNTWAILSSLMTLNIKFNYCQNQRSYLRARPQGGGLLYEGRQAQAVTPRLLRANHHLNQFHDLCWVNSKMTLNNNNDNENPKMNTQRHTKKEQAVQWAGNSSGVSPASEKMQLEYDPVLYHNPTGEQQLEFIAFLQWLIRHTGEVVSTVASQ